MDESGGCCIARLSQVDRIMLRFRPIAPKQPNVGSGSLPWVSGANPRTGGAKRRSYNSVKRCNSNRKRKSTSSSSKEEKMAATATLPLLPETPVRGSPPPRGNDHFVKAKKNFPVCFSFSNYDNNNNINCHVAPPGGAEVVDRVVGSCVTVECVTEAWMKEEEEEEEEEEEARGVRVTEKEIMASLERDTCPGFVCDGFGRVTWTNKAYKKMVCGGSEEREVMEVWLVTKDKVPVMVTLAACHGAFTCRVRVEYKSKSVTVPCDVWRMVGGGFAWRLDVDVALRLGR